MHPRADVVLGVSHAGVKRVSEFRDWVHDDADDSPIEQVTVLRRTPLFLGMRFFLMDRGRAVGSLVWVPTRFAPYLGAAVGTTWYSLSQDGEFVDYETLDIFKARLESSGWSGQVHVFGGAEWWSHTRFGFTAEARYSWGSAELNKSYSEFETIDLRGFQVTGGLATRF